MPDTATRQEYNRVLDSYEEQLTSALIHFVEDAGIEGSASLQQHEPLVDALAKSKLPVDIAAFRALSEDAVARLRAIKKGDKIIIPEPISAAADLTLLDGSYMMKLLVPKGSNALLVGAAAATMEREIVIAACTLTFIGVRAGGHGTTVWVFSVNTNGGANGSDQ